MPLLEFVLPASLFAEPPVIGAVYTSPTGSARSVLCVTGIRRLIGGPAGPAYRLIGTRTPIADLPIDLTPLPWPRKPVRPPPKPTVEMFVGPPPPPRITSPEVARTQTRKRVIGIKRGHQLDSQVAVVGHQIETGKVTSVRIRDIDDLNPQRRVPRMIDGFRNTTDPIDHLLTNGSITKKQAHAVSRLRRYFELGAIGSTHGPVWDSVPAGYGPSAGPSMVKLENLRHYQRAQAALGSLFDIVLHICLVGETLTRYSLRTAINRQMVAGRLGASLDCLMDYFERIDSAAKARAEAH